MYVAKQVTETPIIPIYHLRFDNTDLLPQIDSFSLGPMAAGVSRYPDSLMPSVVATILDYKKASLGDPGGVSVPVQQNNGNIASRTFYLKLPEQIAEASALVAQVVFDLPDVFTQSSPTDPEVAATTGWAVSVNFKDGNQDDLSTDIIRIGPTCHFANNVQAKLNFTNTTDPLPPVSTYANYLSHRTSFLLTVRIRRTFTVGIGDASLKVGNAPAQIGDLTSTVDPLYSTSGKRIEQVGVAIVSATPTAAIVRARLQNFSLWMTP